MEKVKKEAIVKEIAKLKKKDIELNIDQEQALMEKLLAKAGSQVESKTKKIDKE
jgi:hypothetical protein